MSSARAPASTATEDAIHSSPSIRFGRSTTTRRVDADDRAVTLLFLLGCVPETPQPGRVKDPVAKAESDEWKRKYEDAERRAQEAAQSAVNAGETLRLVEETLVELGAVWPQLRQFQEEFETDIAQEQSTRDTMLKMLNQIAAMHGTFEQRTREAEAKLARIREQLPAMSEAERASLEARLASAEEQARKHLEAHQTSVARLGQLEAELEQARQEVDERDALIREREEEARRRLEEMEQLQRRLADEERQRLLRRWRIAPVKELLADGALVGRRFGRKRAACETCGCTEDVPPENGVFEVPAPSGAVQVFSHPTSMYTEVPVDKFRTQIRVKNPETFWQHSSCLIVGY